MDDPNQIEVPASFVALYASPSGHRLLEPMDTVRRRYELCEDLAQMLIEQASTLQFKTGAPEEEVLATLLAGLAAPESTVQPAEAGWVVRRLAELLEWRLPPMAELASITPHARK
ncbi:hypothetical protein [Ramlibacter sp.]|uniref:hypothetical protein n=1 Tax=Ramlibacter sp. TaxID=1917967 RepID=UPI002D4F603E|nr:hypothetical protein [Ramlibacter sp.]HYD76634.1 hypothetical protein [Ramlibacter sp.]